MPDQPLDLGVGDSHHLNYLRSALSTWLTLALDGGFDGPSEVDLLNLRDWVDAGAPEGEMPEPVGVEADPTLANRTAMSMRVFWETREFTAAQFRTALVEARLRAR